AHPQPAPPRGQEASAPARASTEARGEAADRSRAAAACAHGRTHRTGSDLVAHAHRPGFGIERGCATGPDVELGTAARIAAAARGRNGTTKAAQARAVMARSTEAKRAREE